MQPARLPLRVIRGATFNQPIRLSSPRQQWVDIQSIEATAPVLALIVDEAIVQDGYMNALTDGFDGK